MIDHVQSRINIILRGVVPKFSTSQNLLIGVYKPPGGLVGGVHCPTVPSTEPLKNMKKDI